MTAKTDDIVSVKDAKTAAISAIRRDLSNCAKAQKHLVATGLLGDFRLCYGWLEQNSDGLILDEDCATALNVIAGDTVTYIKCW